MKYNIFYYLSFHTRVDGIEANSRKEAVAKGMDEAWNRAQAHNGEFEFAEECTGALVDEQGDENYINSEHFDQKEVYDAESCN